MRLGRDVGLVQVHGTACGEAFRRRVQRTDLTHVARASMGSRRGRAMGAVVGFERKMMVGIERNRPGVGSPRKRAGAPTAAGQ